MIEIKPPVNTIWKFTLQLVREQMVHIPGDFGKVKILDVQVQKGCLTLWAFCTPDQPLRAYKIMCFGTGHNMPDFPGIHIGTVQTHDGLVFHFFLLNESPRA